jgi:hypothetical protein
MKRNFPAQFPIPGSQPRGIFVASVVAPVVAPATAISGTAAFASLSIMLAKNPPQVGIASSCSATIWTTLSMTRASRTPAARDFREQSPRITWTLTDGAEQGESP